MRGSWAELESAPLVSGVLVASGENLMIIKQQVLTLRWEYKPWGRGFFEPDGVFRIAQRHEVPSTWGNTSTVTKSNRRSRPPSCCLSWFSVMDCFQRFIKRLLCQALLWVPGLERWKNTELSCPWTLLVLRWLEEPSCPAPTGMSS